MHAPSGVLIAADWPRLREDSRGGRRECRSSSALRSRCTRPPTPHAQDYPTRPITIVSAQASGGASDTITRAIQERLQAALGQPIVLDNRPGASGNVGAAAVARAAPDGYTLMIGTDAMMTSNVHLFKSMPFDPVKDFAPITNGGANIIVLAVHADVPAKSVPSSSPTPRPIRASCSSARRASPRRIISPANC